MVLYNDVRMYFMLLNILTFTINCVWQLNSHNNIIDLTYIFTLIIFILILFEGQTMLLNLLVNVFSKVERYFVYDKHIYNLCA